MKKKDIAVTVGLTTILFLLVVMLGGCNRDLPLEGVTEINTQNKQEESEQIIEETKPKSVSEELGEIEICTSEGMQETENAESELSTEPEICIGVPKADIRNHVMDFSINLFQNSMQKGENTLISPVSVMMALSMTANGAKEETLAEMEETFGASVNALNVYFSEYQTNLPQGEDNQFHIANSIWVNDDKYFTVQKDFIETNKAYYNAGIYKTKFDEKALKDINQWAAENTDGMIKEVLSEIPETTMMYLINAMTFDAKWQDPYLENSVKTGEFTKENGQIQNASFMHSIEGGFLEDNNTTGFVKYYKESEYAFVALLPKEGISMEDYMKSLSGEKITALLENPQRAMVRASVPKFENECTLDIEPILKTMGIEDAFDREKADLSNLGSYADGNVYIDSVTHKTYISVAEQGTKAGALTIISDNVTGAMMEMKQVYLERPFVYLIIDCEENLPLFMGTVVSIE